MRWLGLVPGCQPTSLPVGQPVSQSANQPHVTQSDPT
ncbi:unnamed protein product [Protopolystoma xenopodis]|uniref:Uncharacterized protein n=1 Tax=Protopolystoma xenopodis TaxID=117903 RepID=A0A3S5B7F7_9PLAT|nr:unnamed protein product [Protopolystoma xenopodis]